jgi:hypothetical protein
MNERRWETMTPGDVVLIYNNGRIRFAGEIADKVRNPELARYFWREDDAGSTWKLMYFIVNEERTDVPIETLNPVFGYETHRPQGFSRINDDAVLRFAQNYGDILGVLKTLERGEELIHIPTRNATISASIDERIERVPTAHDEMQWRLIRLGHLAKCAVWVPRNDQPKQYLRNRFRDDVLHEFHETLDVPRSIENIDVVWKFGPYSIKSAFEIEHSTSIYSGILRLSISGRKCQIPTTLCSSWRPRIAEGGLSSPSHSARVWGQTGSRYKSALLFSRTEVLSWAQNVFRRSQ